MLASQTINGIVALLFHSYLFLFCGVCFALFIYRLQLFVRIADLHLSLLSQHDDVVIVMKIHHRIGICKFVGVARFLIDGEFKSESNTNNDKYEKIYEYVVM